MYLLLLRQRKLLGRLISKKQILDFKLVNQFLMKKFLEKGLAKKSTILLIDFFFKILKKKLYML